MSSYSGSGFEFASGTIVEATRPLSFPALVDIDGVSALRENAVHWRAPWFWPAAIDDVLLVSQYCIADELPRRIPVNAIQSEDKTRRLCLPTEAIQRRLVSSASPTNGGRGKRGHTNKRFETVEEARKAFTKLVFQRLHCTAGRSFIPASTGIDTWICRSEGEAGYCHLLVRLQYACWRNAIEVRDFALAWDTPILHADFRYVRKADVANAYWENIRWERKARSCTGYLVPYQCIEIGRVKPRYRGNRYVLIQEYFHQVEVPRGCAVELPPCITYLGVELMKDPCSGLWVVFYSEFAARAAAFILWNVYDTGRLWFLPEILRGYILALKLRYVLGSPYNEREILHPLEVMNQVNWNEVSVGNKAKCREFP